MGAGHQSGDLAQGAVFLALPLESRRRAPRPRSFSRSIRGSTACPLTASTVRGWRCGGLLAGSQSAPARGLPPPASDQAAVPGYVAQAGDAGGRRGARAWPPLLPPTRQRRARLAPWWRPMPVPWPSGSFGALASDGVAGDAIDLVAGDGMPLLAQAGQRRRGLYAAASRWRRPARQGWRQPRLFISVEDGGGLGRRGRRISSSGFNGAASSSAAPVGASLAVSLLASAPTFGAGTSRYAPAVLA